jgi:hypothetical protein
LETVAGPFRYLGPGGRQEIVPGARTQKPPEVELKSLAFFSGFFGGAGIKLKHIFV